MRVFTCSVKGGGVVEGGEFGCQTSSLRFSCHHCFSVHLGSLLVLPEPPFPHL